jgi:para-nitrobenzyl esterase
MKVGLAAALMLGAFCAEASANPSVVVDGVTIDGAVSSLDSTVDNYFGIPYATAARWSPPMAHAPLGNPFDASQFSNVAVCPQNEPVAIAGVTLKQSEDCLSLNVFVPESATPSSKLPVLVWIHGGAFESGAGVEYQPIAMVANHNVIVVSINYRLGALGWLAQQAIEAGKTDAFENAQDSGNYGLMDQQFALGWVKKNIAAFGGDARKVTIAGESAGGFSVALQLTSTGLAAGLFRGAIIQSGAYEFYDMPPKGLYEIVYGNRFVNAVLSGEGSVGKVDCSALNSSSDAKEVRKCLDGASVSSLLAAENAVSFLETPASGTRIVPGALDTAFANGSFLKVPVMQGTNLNEGRYFEPDAIPFAQSFSDVVAAGGPANYDLANANALCGGSKCTYTQEINLGLAAEGFPSGTNTQSFDSSLAKKYPLKHFPDPYLSGNAPSADEGLAQIGTDWRFSCNALDADGDMAQFVALHAYEFNDPEAPPTQTPPAVTQPPNDQYGYPTASEHGAELQFLFAFPSTPSLSSDEQALANAMQSYWANFVATGDPNKGSRVASWPAFGGSEEIQTLAPGHRAIKPNTNFATTHVCSLWHSVNAN